MKGAKRFGFHFGRESLTLHSERVEVHVPGGIETKKDLLAVLDAGLQFPDYFGENWDALWECIRDLEWLEPVQIVLIHEDVPLQNDPRSSVIYLDILRHAVARWEVKRRHELVVVFPRECAKTVRSLMMGGRRLRLALAAARKAAGRWANWIRSR